MNICVVSTFDGTKEDYLKSYDSFKDDIAKYTDEFEMGFVRDGKVIVVANVRDEEKFYAIFDFQDLKNLMLNLIILMKYIN